MLTKKQKTALETIQRRFKKILDVNMQDAIEEEYKISSRFSKGLLAQKISASRIISNNIIYVAPYIRTISENLYNLLMYGYHENNNEYKYMINPFNVEQVEQCYKDLENIIFNLKLKKSLTKKTEIITTTRRKI